jgi:hypothetical protein
MCFILYGALLFANIVSIYGNIYNDNMRYQISNSGYQMGNQNM